MYKIKASISTNNGVLQAGKVLDIEKYLKPSEIKDLEKAGFIEVYIENVENNFEQEIEDLKSIIVEKDEKIEDLLKNNKNLERQVKTLEKKLEKSN